MVFTTRGCLAQLRRPCCCVSRISGAARSTSSLIPPWPLRRSRTAAPTQVGLAPCPSSTSALPETWHHKTTSFQNRYQYKRADSTSIRASAIQLSSSTLWRKIAPRTPFPHRLRATMLRRIRELMRWVRTAPQQLHDSISLTSATTEPESDDNFTDAQSQTRSRSQSRPESPIPITRVERVDHDAAYGEVPGTDAYEMRTEDARPDEIAFIPDDKKLDSAPPSGAVSPGGQPIPKTVVEEVPASPVMGGLSRRGTLHSHKRNPSDAMPDLVLQVEDTGNASPVKSPHSESLFVPDFNSAKHESSDKDDKDTPGMCLSSHFPTPIDQVRITNQPCN